MVARLAGPSVHDLILGDRTITLSYVTEVTATEGGMRLRFCLPTNHGSCAVVETENADETALMNRVLRALLSLHDGD